MNHRRVHLEAHDPFPGNIYKHWSHHSTATSQCMYGIADVMTYRSDNFTFMVPVSPYNLVSGIIFGTALLIVSFIAKLI